MKIEVNSVYTDVDCDFTHLVDTDTYLGMHPRVLGPEDLPESDEEVEAGVAGRVYIPLNRPMADVRALGTYFLSDAFQDAAAVVLEDSVVRWCAESHGFVRTLTKRGEAALQAINAAVDAIPTWCAEKMDAIDACRKHKVPVENYRALSYALRTELTYGCVVGRTLEPREWSRGRRKCVTNGLEGPNGIIDGAFCFTEGGYKHGNPAYMPCSDLDLYVAARAIKAGKQGADTEMIEHYSSYDLLELDDSQAADPVGRLEEVNRWWDYIKANTHG